METLLVAAFGNVVEHGLFAARENSILEEELENLFRAHAELCCIAREIEAFSEESEA